MSDRNDPVDLTLLELQSMACHAIVKQCLETHERAPSEVRGVTSTILKTYGEPIMWIGRKIENSVLGLRKLLKEKDDEIDRLKKALQNHMNMIE